MRHIQAGNKETITVVSLCKMTRNMGVFSYLHCFHAVAGETCFFLFGPGGSWVGGGGLNGPLRQYFSLYRTVSKKEGKKKK